MLLRLASRLVTVVRQTKFQVLASLFFFNSISSHQCFLVVNAAFHVRWTNITPQK